MRRILTLQLVLIVQHSGNFEYINIAGTEYNGELLQLQMTVLLFNEDGRDRDFRVESDTNANMLFVDGW
jgi:prepilin-type processing-associated H-X9-DG protein